MIVSLVTSLKSKRISAYLLLVLGASTGGITIAGRPQSVMKASTRVQGSKPIVGIPMLDEGRIGEARKQARQTVHDHLIVSRLLTLAPLAYQLATLYGVSRFFKGGSKETAHEPGACCQRKHADDSNSSNSGSSSSSSSSSSSASIDAGASGKEQAEAQSWPSAAWSGLKDWGINEYNDWTSWGKWKEWGNKVGSSVGGAACSVVSPRAWGKQVYAMGTMVPMIATHTITGAIIGKIQQKINHPDTILWYRDTQTSYVQIMNDVIMYAERIEKGESAGLVGHDTVGILPQCATADKVLSRKLFLRSARELVKQMQLMLGYIDYKSADFKRDRALTTRIKDTIRTKTNTVITECNMALSALARGNATGVATQLSGTLKRYRDAMNTCIDDFARLSTNGQEQSYNRMVAGHEQSANIGRRIQRLPEADKEKVAAILQQYEMQYEQE